MRTGEKVISINQNNKGISLVELLVVIAILSILTGVSSISISLAMSRDAEKCARTIDMALESVRMSSMSQKGIFTLEIDSTDNQIITILDKDASTPIRTEELQKQAIISFQAGGVDRPDIEKLQVTFDKSTGKVTAIQDQDDDSVDDNLIRIRCTNRSGSKVATVVLIKKTGKHYVEYGS